MNYLKTYIKLVKKAKNRELPEGTYVERHHVFPVSIFGRKGNKNTVKLTYKEHLVAHHLLYKACVKRYGTGHYRAIKMGYAFFFMINRAGQSEASMSSIANYIRKANKSSESIKGRNSHMHGKTLPKSTRDKISAALTGRRFSKESLERRSKSRTGIPCSDEAKKKISDTLTGKYVGENSPSYGKKHSAESLKRMSEAKMGEKNSNYGRTGAKHPLYGKTGENSANFDSNVYTWENINTGVIEQLTGYGLRTKYGLTAGGMSYIKKDTSKTHKGWRRIESNINKPD